MRGAAFAESQEGSYCSNFWFGDFGWICRVRLAGTLAPPWGLLGWGETPGEPLIPTKSKAGKLSLGSALVSQSTQQNVQVTGSRVRSPHRLFCGSPHPLYWWGENPGEPKHRCQTRLLPSFWKAEISPNMPRQMVINLSVTRNRLFTSIRRVPIDVVPSSRTEQFTACGRELSNEFPPFQTRTSLN